VNCSSCERYATVDDSARIEIDILAIVVCFTAWSGICHVGCALSPGHDNGGAGRYYRAVDYAVSAPLMLVPVSMVCGVNDVGQVVNSMAVMSLVVVVDYIGDVEDCAKRLFWPSCAAYLAYWALIWAAFGFSAGGGDGRAEAPVFVYFIVFGTMATFSSFAVLRGVTLFRTYTFTRTEALYAVLSLVAKTQLSWLLFIGVLADMTGEEVEEGAELEGALTVFLSTMTVGIVAAVFVVKYVEEPEGRGVRKLLIG
jgi:hypothetical protein